MIRRRALLILLLLLAILIHFSAVAAAQPIIVTVTAYNSLSSQTDSTPFIAAWGDRVFYGMLAVSRDLEAAGITRGTVVHLESLGYFIVLDRMHRRKKNQVDIWMRTEQEALSFGRKQLKLTVCKHLYFYQIGGRNDKSVHSGAL
jgi:3D (Asp-Asp-Asp) domain-containing protein